MFPNLGEVAFCRRHPKCSSSALPSGYQSYYSLGVWAVWVLLLWQADYVILLGVAGSWSGWAPGPALCSGCQLLVGWARS